MRACGGLRGSSAKLRYTRPIQTDCCDSIPVARDSRASGGQPTVLLTVIALPLAAESIQETKPEEAGLSPKRLQRIHEAVQRHIDDHDISGAVILVARKGRAATSRRTAPEFGVENAEGEEGSFLDRLDVQPTTGVAILRPVPVSPVEPVAYPIQLTGYALSSGNRSGMGLVGRSPWTAADAPVRLLEAGQGPAAGESARPTLAPQTSAT
jgi:hypothetical protein